MKLRSRKFFLFGGVVLLGGLTILWPPPASAQWPFPPPPITPDAQRTALNGVRSAINFFQNATRTAPNYVNQDYHNTVWPQFQELRQAYNNLKQTLSPRQLATGGNGLAELDAGLDILQEAFTNYENDVAAGRSANSALRDMCQVLRQGSQVWSQEFEKNCSRLRIGWP